jgi:hypothetical protein
LIIPRKPRALRDPPDLPPPEVATRFDRTS